MTGNPVLKLRSQLGTPGMTSLALLAFAILFLYFIQRPLVLKSERLGQHLAQSERETSGNAHDRGSSTSAKMAAFYRFFESDKQATDWLEKLNAIGQAAGLELPSAEYRVQKTQTRIERFEIALPISGSYRQIRAFLKNALAEIPVLSLDQVSFKRAHADDATLHAQVRFTLHIVKQ